MADKAATWNSGKLRPHPGVLAKRLDDAVVLVHLDTEQIHELNDTAGRFWELLNEGLDREAIANQLLKEFQVDAQTLTDNIDELVRDLIKKELLTVNNNE